MNKHLHKLDKMSSKPSRLIIGLMSGTSLDGLDIALCRISDSGKDTKLVVEAFDMIPYENTLRDQLKSIFCKKKVDLSMLTLLHAHLGHWYAKKINQCLKKWGVSSQDIDCIASHGQTIYHAPQRLHQIADMPNATLQIVDADHIAYLTQIITIGDFRQKHIVMGGEGAPLALYGDYLLFSNPSENRILLNIGGISNFTFLPKSNTLNKVISSDLGPGNTLIDRAMEHFYKLQFDNNGDIARSGKCDAYLLNLFLEHPFFEQSLPKSTGQETFSWEWVREFTAQYNISPSDLICTLTHLTVQGIAKAIQQNIASPYPTIFVGGGGVHNSYLIELLEKEGFNIERMDKLGMLADAKEAALFALLANETICGSNVFGASTLGKISLP